MRILMIAYVDKNSEGGIKKSVTEISSLLKLRGYKVDTFFKEKTFLDYYYILFAIKSFLFFLMKISKYDIIIYRSTDGFLISCFVNIFKLPVKTILYSHGWEEFVYKTEKYIPNYIKYPKTTLFSKLIRFPILKLALKHSSICICGTKHESKKLRKKYPAYSKKIKFLSNGCYRYNPYWINKDEYPLNFVFIGSYTWKKNAIYTFDLFIKIKEKFPDAKLYVVGNFNENKFIKYFTKKEYEIIYYGELSQKDVFKLFEKTPYMFALSRYEGGHPFTLLEAMGHGIIPFVSDIPAYTGVVRDYYSGIILNGYNLEKDADKISDFLNTKDQTIMRYNVVGRINKYNWKTQIDILESFWKE